MWSNLRAYRATLLAAPTSMAELSRGRGEASRNPPWLGVAYGEHLSREDLAELARLAAVDPAELRRDPALLVDVLARAEVVGGLLAVGVGEGHQPGGVALAPTSPFLVFAAVVEAGARDLAAAPSVPEWVGPRRRVPVLGPADLVELLEAPERRFFLASLLASFTTLASGSVVLRTRRGLRRQRFNELDPVRLASLLEVVPVPERPGLYRRLGDVALFLTGVFPDHTAGGLGPHAEGRLLRTLPARAGVAVGSGSGLPPGLAVPPAVALLETLGPQWYRAAWRAVQPPRPSSLEVAVGIADRFDVARRTLNVLSERYLFSARERWWGMAGGSGPYPSGAAG